MATPLVLPQNPQQPLQQQQNGGVNRRYRPAPAKTFQCRGYGDCRMVFSRSEHLARHIRKHTGERPFTCHCSKQFSRLDNLRQHAQTVHADKQDANERMMRELSSLHATMAAANKATQQRGKRGAQQAPPVSVSLSADSITGDASGDPASTHRVHQQQHQGGGGEGVKQEDTQPTLSLVSQRPGTSTGYEGDTDLFHHQHPSAASRSWYVQDADRSHPRQVSSHSFRDSVQSFRAPSAASPTSPTSSTSPISATPTSSPSTLQPHPGHSSSSRPPTASRESIDSHPRSLPPLSAIVSSSLPPSQWGSVPSQSVFPIPSGPGIVPPRPSTATRPGTAPASYYASPPFGGFGGGSGLVLSSSTTNPYGISELVRSSSGYGSADASDSPIGGGYDSPFSFHPPSLTNESFVSRKRPFSGIDDDDRERLGSSAGGSESRPQSRRLSVMELCNDIDSDPATRPFLPLSTVQGGTGSTSRPNTASTSLAALAIADAPTPFEQQYRQQSPIRAGIQAGGGTATGLSSPSSGTSSSTTTSPRGSSIASTSPRAGAATTTGRVQSQYSHQFQHHPQRPPVFGNVVPSSVLRGGTASASPPLRAVSGAGGAGASAYTSPGSSPGSNASAPRGYGAAESRRERADQVRLAVSSPHAASALGMRV
ncbi:hypothetical protein EDB92DRAFT_1797371 [Lactarius akahatsu]|uniref:C2H2-type domain-containing protein n=1 Tax=Lactarius akahatsu TaxID=416441 RepID=A0AAD4LGA6_9AGAM|nr:hypothetical protein EDB92DRAFT_1797371 [Lactarius akahatsu]